MTVSSQYIISNELNRFYITKTIQSHLDSMALVECEQQSVLYQSKFESMSKQSDNFYNQLVVTTDKLNESNKENLHLTKSVKTKNVLIVGLAILSTILIIK